MKKNAKKVKEALDEIKYGENISFEEFLNKLDLTEQHYISAIRMGLTRNTLFLKRNPSGIRVNNTIHISLEHGRQTWIYNIY